MKAEKGITLIALVITIVILLILTSIATYSGIDVINSSKLTAFTAEMEIMQTQVNSIYEKYRDGQTISINGESYMGEQILTIESSSTSSDITTQKNKIFQNLSSDPESGVNIDEKENYKFWDSDLMKKLGIESTEKSYFVNIKKRSIISYEGLSYKGKMYYTLQQLPDSLYNVEYDNPNGGTPTFSVVTNKQSENEWKIEISDIQYDGGYINKWEVQYKLEEQEYWNTSENLSFIVNKPGKYTIKIVNGTIESAEKEEVLSE